MKKKNAIIKPAKPYKIDSGIKLPEPAKNGGLGQAGRAVATANLMKVGDSFLVKDPYEATRAAKNIRDLMHRQRATGGAKSFTQRMVKGGIRFWRVK